jgi:hypothetical protein
MARRLTLVATVLTALALPHGRRPRTGLGIARPATSLSVRPGSENATTATDVYGVAHRVVHPSHVRDEGVYDVAA